MRASAPHKNAVTPPQTQPDRESDGEREHERGYDQEGEVAMDPDDVTVFE